MSVQSLAGERYERASLQIVRRWWAWPAVAVLAGAALIMCLPRHAHAADLSGDCCADLEERIAELEDTAARKGNRKVTVTVSGQVNQAVLAWDDGAEENAYVVMNSNSSDRLRFDGSAAVTSDMTAGFYLELGSGVGSTARADQFDSNASIDSVRVRQLIWYVDSKKLGAISVGQGAPSTDDIIAFNLGGTSVAGSANTSLVGANLLTRDATTDGLNSLSAGNTMALRWRRFVDRLDTPTSNLVRYDTPVLMGFTLSASWGEDDYWDAALRYATKGPDFRFAFGIGYLEDRNEDSDTFGWPSGGDTEPNGRDTLVREIKGSASLLHVPTGLFVSGAYVHREFSGDDLGVLTFACFTSGDAQDIRDQGVACSNRPSYDYYWLSAGIKRKFFSIGPTSLYGEFARSEDAVTGLNVSINSAAGGDIDYVTSSTMTIWGAGIVQSFSDASMEMYVAYRHFDADVEGLESGGGTLVAPIHDADVVMVGSRIRF